MGPSTLVDGDAACASGLGGRRAASMGPSTLVDGDAGDLQQVRRRSRTDRLERAVHDHPASMGPSTLVDGDTARGGACRSMAAGFNGAVDSRRRRPRARQPVAGPRAWASMGPSTLVDGDSVPPPI